MLNADQNRLLTEVEGDAPMGRFMRRHWIPCARGASLVADGPPKLVRLLGSNYVAFRATDGRIGFFDEACPHRGASLMLARNEDCSLRCIFHGWKFDVSGKAVEIPSERAGASALTERISAKSYPTFEGGGLLWVFLGEGDPPPRPPLSFLDLPEENVWITRSISPCNWLQGVEGTLDSIHVGTLHQSWIGKTAGPDLGINVSHTLDSHPQYEVDYTSYGLRAAAVRKLADNRKYVRVTEYVMPFISLVPASSADGSDGEGVIFMSVPMDNHSHMLFWGQWDENGPANDYALREFCMAEPDFDNLAAFKGDRESAWGQNREAMAAGHFTGFDQCLLQEDIIVQVSMGPVVDRTKEHLCANDLAVARARTRLLQALRDMDNGGAQAAAAETELVRPLDTVGNENFQWREFAPA